MRREQILYPMLRAVAARPRVADLLLGRDRWGNPLAPANMADPYLLMPRILADGPVYHHRTYQQWFVVGYEEARQILSSDDVRAGGQIDVLLDVRPYSNLGDRARFLFKTLLPIVDPPDHPRLRGLVARAFTPRRIAEMEQAVETVAADLLDRLPASGRFDVHTDYALPLPTNVIGHMLGVPAEHWPRLQQLNVEIVKLIDPLLGFDPSAMDDAVDELWSIYGELAEARRAEPTDDLISAMVEPGPDGDRLTHDELMAMVGTLMAAGFETTSGVLGTAIVALDRFRDQRQLLLDDPELWPNAVEELLRFDTPVKVAGRQATADIAIGGEVIPEGANIIISLMAAHRDPARYDNADELRLDRPDPHPVSFGHGAHHCLGAALARMEIRVGLRAFLDRYPDYSIDADGVAWRTSMTLRNHEHITVTA